MKENKTIAYIQARMSSSRYPGKSLAPLNGKPIIKHVVDRVGKVERIDEIIVLTTTEQAEDPLVSYLESENIKTYRGDPINVFERFKSATQQFPCGQFFRVCGDSPFLEPNLFRKAINIFNSGDYDIVTNSCPNKFPSGKRVELFDTDVFTNVESERLTEDEKEHVTLYFYNNKDEYSTFNIKPKEQYMGSDKYAVDTISDLKKLEKELMKGENNDVDNIVDLE